MDIAKNSGVSFRHALREIEKLKQLNLIKQTRTVGHAQMYKLNTDNPAAVHLSKFTLQLASTEVDQELARQRKEQHAKETTKEKPILT
jgi:type IV secretory pathway TrbF-like protein